MALVSVFRSTPHLPSQPCSPRCPASWVAHLADIVRGRRGQPGRAPALGDGGGPLQAGGRGKGRGGAAAPTPVARIGHWLASWVGSRKTEAGRGYSVRGFSQTSGR